MLLAELKVAVLKVEFRVMGLPVPALAMLVMVAVELLGPDVVEVLLVELADPPLMVKRPE